MKYLGVDIGCSSIKYGLVCLDDETTVENFNTHLISLIDGVEKYLYAISKIISQTSGYQVAGFGFPSQVCRNRILRKTFDFDSIWCDIQGLLHSKNVPCFALNDADAAGIAEIHRKEAVELRNGVTILLTLGTGIGSAIFLDGKLVPNTELGTLEMHEITAEKYAAPSTITQENLSIEAWTGRLQEYLEIVEHIIPPDHLILGGGISENFLEYAPVLKTRSELVPAYYRNQAGVIGAAIYAAQQMEV